MRTSVTVAILAASVAFTEPAWAQSRSERGAVPATGMVAVGGSVSLAVPVAPDLSKGWDIAVDAQRYFTPRLSLRGQLGGSWADINGHSFQGTSNPVRVNGNVVYNWERGTWHPHVTAGAGMYRYRFVESQQFRATNELGANVGGGAEYFAGRANSFTGEVLFHYVPGRVSSRLTNYDPRFWTLSIGYKRYFRGR